MSDITQAGSRGVVSLAGLVVLYTVCLEDKNCTAFGLKHGALLDQNEGCI